MSDYVASPVSDLDLDQIIMHCLRCDPVIAEASSRLSVDDFDHIYHRAHAVIYIIAQEFYRQNRRTIPRQILLAELDKRMANQPDFAMPSVRERVYKMVSQAFELQSEDLVPSWALRRLSNFLYIQHIGEQLSKIEGMRKQGFEPTADDIRNLQTIAADSAIVSAPIVKPFSPGTIPLLGVRPKLPSGVNFIDDMLGGGFQTGRLYAVTAPTGGGKSTLSNQIAVAQAMNGHRVLVCSYEEEVNAEYMAPIIANATNIRRCVIEQVSSVESLCEADRAKYHHAAVALGENLYYADMSTEAGFGGVEEIEALLRRYTSQGIRYEGLVIDWFSAMAKRAYSRAEFPRFKELDERQFSQHLMDGLRRISLEHNVWIWIAQQQAPAEVSRKASAQWNESAEFKSFVWLCSYAFCLNQMCENQICEINLSKGRACKTSKQHIRLNGDYARFEPLSDEYEWDPRQRVHVKADTRYKVPSEDAV